MSQDNPSLIVITGNSWRHRYFANRLIKSFEVRGVVSEETRALPQDATPAGNQIIESHVWERAQKEKLFFGGEADFNLPAGQVLRVARGEPNSESMFNWVVECQPAFVILFGSSIIKDPLLGAFKDKVINLHLGLSPYYRGSATSFWPLVFRQPECVGATVHLAVLKADAGSILAQARPDVAVEDQCQEFGCKNIMVGTELMVDCIKAYHQSKVVPQPQQLERGRVFKLSNFNAQAVLAMRANFDSGMMAEYLSRKLARDGQYPIVTLPRL